MAEKVETKHRFPEYEDQLRKLVADHGQIEEEKLLFAAYYAPGRDEDDIFLFEIADNFGHNTVNSHREFFEIGFREVDRIDLKEGQVVKMVLTNPVEFERAAREEWWHFNELRKAKANDKWIPLYGDEKWDQMI